MARSQNSYTFDVDTNLKVSAAVTSSGAEALVIDLGDSYVEFDVVVDVTTMERGTADETYDIRLQLSDTIDFSGVVVPGPGLHFGEEIGTGGDPDADAIGGRQVMRCNNERLDVQFRFARLDNVVAGTTPSITYSAFMAKNS